jgi:hypothetical protein
MMLCVTRWKILVSSQMSQFFSILVNKMFSFSLNIEVSESVLCDLSVFNLNLYELGSIFPMPDLS